MRCDKIVALLFSLLTVYKLLIMELAAPAIYFTAIPTDWYISCRNHTW
jgi:hypothetical protein